MELRKQEREFQEDGAGDTSLLPLQEVDEVAGGDSDGEDQEDGLEMQAYFETVFAFGYRLVAPTASEAVLAATVAKEEGATGAAAAMQAGRKVWKRIGKRLATGQSSGALWSVVSATSSAHSLSFSASGMGMLPGGSAASSRNSLPMF